MMVLIKHSEIKIFVWNSKRSQIRNAVPDNKG